MRSVTATCASDGCVASASCNAATEVLTGAACSSYATYAGYWAAALSIQALTTTSVTCAGAPVNTTTYARALCMAK